VNIADPATDLKTRARRFGFQVLLQPERPEGWLVTLRPAGSALATPLQVSAPTRVEAIATASRLLETKLVDHLVDTLVAAGAAVPNWTPGQEWDGHVEALAAAVSECGRPS